MKRHKNRKNKKLLVQGNELPSTTPLDRSAVFTREDLENHTTYHEYNRFTVMGLDLQPDITCDGQISAADSGALALDWNRAWLIPASTNAWFPVKIFKDVAMPGVYTVVASTNITMRYNGVVLTPGGETVSFPQSQSQETLEVQAAAPGAATLAVTFTGTGTATNYNCSTCVKINAWGVESINVTSPKLGVSPNPPPFKGGTNWIFSVTNSPTPDKHAVVLYKDVVDGSFNVQDFDVTMTATLAPADMPTDGLTFHWEKIEGPDSGQLLPSGLTAVYRNPKKGGVYRFRFTIRQSNIDRSFGEAVLVLPLAGAEMDGVIQANLPMADAFVTALKARYTTDELQRMRNLMRWFWDNHAGDYTGRPDNVVKPTVWYYNPVNDGTGFGSVCTWKGRPVRLTKPSNFIIGYAMQQIGISRTMSKTMTRPFAVMIETTDRASVGAGWDVATGENYGATVSTLVGYIWTHEDDDDKSRKVWPNFNAPDNYRGSASGELFNYNTWYAIPGFLFMTQ